ncbi:MAG: branched-chain amino acid transporter permease [Eubacterium sp.]
MNSMIHSLLQVIIIALCTAALRFLPFLVFPAGRKKPKVIIYLGKVLPYAIMGMLVVYCLRNVSIINSPFGIPELLSIILVIVLHLWKHNNLLSIFAGTACYMFLLQVVFA